MNVEISEKDAIIESKNLENVDALGASSKEKQSLVAEICSLQEAIENKAHEIVAIKDDGEKKFNTAMERVKRMKVLLTKSQSVKAEKEAELKKEFPDRKPTPPCKKSSQVTSRVTNLPLVIKF